MHLLHVPIPQCQFHHCLVDPAVVPQFSEVGGRDLQNALVLLVFFTIQANPAMETTHTMFDCANFLLRCKDMPLGAMKNCLSQGQRSNY